MPGSLARTRDTVAIETPAEAAISAWRGRFGLLSFMAHSHANNANLQDKDKILQNIFYCVSSAAEA
jgi:hypothetical protein